MVTITSVIAEHRPRLQACNIFVSVSETFCEGCAFRLEVEGSGVDVKWTSKGLHIYHKIVLSECKLIPGTISGLQFAGRSFSFRVQTEPLDKSSGSISAEIVPLENPNIVCDEADTIPTICALESYKIECRNCSNVLTVSPVLFQRVLPMPSRVWEDAAGEWFCHRQKSHDELFSSMLEPKENDCFYGTKFWLLRTSHMQHVLTEGCVVKCKRCDSWLGTCKSSAVKLWNSTIVWDSCEMRLCTTLVALKDFRCVIRKLVQESVEVICRICVEVQISTNNKHYLLLRIMDKNIQLFCYIDDQATGCKENSDLIGGLSRSETSNTTVSGTLLEARSATKLLYKYHSECTDIVKTWLKDINVHNVEMSKNMVQEALQHLKKVSGYLPIMLQMTNDFHVSYLGLF